MGRREKEGDRFGRILPGAVDAAGGYGEMVTVPFIPG